MKAARLACGEVDRPASWRGERERFRGPTSGRETPGTEVLALAEGKV